MNAASNFGAINAGSCLAISKKLLLPTLYGAKVPGVHIIINCSVATMLLNVII